MPYHWSSEIPVTQVTNMNIEDFAGTYRLRIHIDQCREQIIPGKLGHIFDHGSGKFGIVLEEIVGSSRGRLLLARRRTALQADFQMTQQGEFESVLLFDPNDCNQVRLAIRLVKARKKRTVHSNPASLRNLLKTPTQMPLQAVGTTHMAG
jgi:hypothetical protein